MRTLARRKNSIRPRLPTMTGRINLTTKPSLVEASYSGVKSLAPGVVVITCIAVTHLDSAAGHLDGFHTRGTVTNSDEFEKEQDFARTGRRGAHALEPVPFSALWAADGRTLSVAWIYRQIWGQRQSDKAIELFQVPREISFTFHFWQKSFILMVWILQICPTTVLHERMWHFRGQNILWSLLHDFRGPRAPIPRIYALNPFQLAIWCTLAAWPAPIGLNAV